jgi:hypothetical protein
VGALTNNERLNVKVYFMMNVALRSQDRSLVQPWKFYIWLLLHALKKLPRVNGCDVVFRGMKTGVAELGENYESGEEFQFAAFVSTTTNIEVLQHFLGKEGPRTLLHMSLSAPVARDVKDFSLHPQEKEIMLPPNLMFEVQGVLDMGNDLKMVQCSQIESLDELLEF